MMKEEAIKLREVIAILHLKHKEYFERIQNYINSHSLDESEIKRLAGIWDRSFWTYLHLLYSIVAQIIYNICVNV